MNKVVREIGRHILPSRWIRVIRPKAQRILPAFVPPPNYEMLYIRTEQELALRAKGLKELCDVLDALGIPYFLSGGALLGVVRDADFIKWDFDVDIDTTIETVRARRHLLIPALEQSGFEIQTYDPSRTDFKVCALKHGTRYEIAGYLRVGRMRYRRRSRYPDCFLGSGSLVRLRGESFKTFGAPEKYLEWFYGDWRTPRRMTSGYITDRSRTDPISLTMIEIVSLIRNR